MTTTLTKPRVYSEQFSACWKLKWDSLSDGQKAAWREFAYINNIDSEIGPCEPVALHRWDSLSSEQRQSLCAQHDDENNPENEAERVIGWYDSVLDAAMWFSLLSVSPAEAAALLCCIKPHDHHFNPLEVSNMETGPDDFKRLLRVFEDVGNADSQAHTLMQWLCIASNKGLKFHSWAFQYINAKSSVSKNGEQGAACKPFATKTSKDSIAARLSSSVPITCDAESIQRTWHEQARAIADELDKLDEQCGAYDSKSHLAERIADKMREMKIDGPRGPLAPTTILREALQGVRWTRNR